MKNKFSVKLLSINRSESSFINNSFSRNILDKSHLTQTIDNYFKNEIKIHYIKIQKQFVEVDFDDLGKIENQFQDVTFNYVLQSLTEEGVYTIWFPVPPKKMQIDEKKRIASQTEALVDYSLKIDSEARLSIESTSIKTYEVIIFPCIVFKDNKSNYLREIISLTKVETKIYRKSNWFYANKPLDVWNYLINGSLYDPRSHKGINKRFKCQQCAYAWWTYFNFLKQKTGKKIYDILQDEIAYTVLLDLKDNGEWGHGYWSDEIETHARFHLDGLHLLISQYEKTNDLIWLQAAERGMDFVIENLTEPLANNQVWFLHDTIEEERHHHFQSTLFGKTPANSLCLNTHVQALTVLHRLCAVKPEETKYATLFQQGIQALQTALEYKPAERIYRSLDWLMQTFIPAWRSDDPPKKGTLTEKVKTRINNRLCHYFSVFYWQIRSKYPRLVHPNGFTERDLSLSFASDRYHIINLKDFLTLYQQEPLPWLIPVIKNGIEFTRNLDLNNSLQRSSYYIEWVDILALYEKLFNEDLTKEIQQAKEIIYQETHGHSLDYYASEFLK